MYDVDRGIEMPKSCKKEYAYPFSQMGVGDSFLVPLNGEHIEVVRKRIQASISYRSRSTGEKYSTRRIGDGVRVWRVE